MPAVIVSEVSFVKDMPIVVASKLVGQVSVVTAVQFLNASVPTVVRLFGNLTTVMFELPSKAWAGVLTVELDWLVL